MSKKVSRRGFLGILGAGGVAAAIPWKFKKPEAPVDLTEYVGDYDIILEEPVDGEEPWAPVEAHTVEGTWDTKPAFKHGQVCRLFLDGREYDLTGVDVSYTRDIHEDNTVFDNNRTFIRGPAQGAEIDCHIIGSTSSLKHLQFTDRAVSFTLETNCGDYTGAAYMTELTYNVPQYDVCTAELRLKTVGELKRCLA